VDAAKGIKRAPTSPRFQPLIQEIIKELYDKGKGNGERKNLATSTTTTGLAIWSIAVEGGAPCDQKRRLAADAGENQNALRA